MRAALFFGIAFAIISCIDAARMANDVEMEGQALQQGVLYLCCLEPGRGSYNIRTYPHYQTPILSECVMTMAAGYCESASECTRSCYHKFDRNKQYHELIYLAAQVEEKTAQHRALKFMLESANMLEKNLKSLNARFHKINTKAKDFIETVSSTLQTVESSQSLWQQQTQGSMRKLEASERQVEKLRVHYDAARQAFYQANAASNEFAARTTMATLEAVTGDLIRAKKIAKVYWAELVEFEQRSQSSKPTIEELQRRFARSKDAYAMVQKAGPIAYKQVKSEIVKKAKLLREEAQHNLLAAQRLMDQEKGQVMILDAEVVPTPCRGGTCCCVIGGVHMMVDDKFADWSSCQTPAEYSKAVWQMHCSPYVDCNHC